jgi:hypothetical protein
MTIGMLGKYDTCDTYDTYDTSPHEQGSRITDCMWWAAALQVTMIGTLPMSIAEINHIVINTRSMGPLA